MECTSLSSIFSLFWKNYLSVEFPNFDIDAEVKERDKEPNLLVLFSAWNLYMQILLYWAAWLQWFLKASILPVKYCVLMSELRNSTIYQWLWAAFWAGRQR